MSGSTYLQDAPNCIGNESHSEIIQMCEIYSPSSISLSSNSCSTKNTSPGLIAESFTYSTTPKEDQQLKLKSFDGNEEMPKEKSICPASPFVKDNVPLGEKNDSMAVICEYTDFQKDDSTSLASKVEDNSGAKAQCDLGRKEFVNGSINVFERKAEIEPSLYAPPDYAETQNMKSLIIHRLSLQNRPLHMRKSLSIHEVFQNPVTLLWKHKFEKFNVLQSEIAPILVNSNDTIVLSAPTGSGKTGVFEIAIASHIIKDFNSMRENSMNWQCKQLPICRKIVYLSPSKALCEERYDDWTSRLSSLKLGIRTAMITGDDSEPGEAFREISQSHLIITTPERWDSLTRRWTENFVLFGSIKLLLIDEVHLLGDPSRGSCLESVICRMKTIFRATQSGKLMDSQILSSSFIHTDSATLSSDFRIVGVSATMPNVCDIAAFLNASNAFVFDDSYRPVPLTIHVALCGDAGKNQFLFNKNMNQRVPGVIRQFSKGKPTIIFCHTKKESEALASELSHNSNLGFSINNPKLASQTSVIALQRCLLRGVAYHNAGLDILDRKLVEKAFLEGHIKCLCATSTLSVGVNLPAHLVVIKGTSAWRGSEVGYVEVDKGSLLQMIGRAGRMGFDTSGTAVIMTESKYEKRYKELGNNIDCVESQLLPKLVQVFNHEISLKVITDFHSAKNWLATTFLFQQIKGNPNSFGISKDAEMNFCLTKICGTELKKLEDAGLISVCKENGEISPLFACDIMNQHLVEFSSMKAIIELPFLVSIEHLLQAISRFQGIQKAVRRSDKKVLNEVHKTLKYKLDTKSKIRIQEPHQKAFVLLQAAIGQHYFEDFTLRQEMSSNLEFATRILAAAEEYSIYGSKNGQVALQCLKLRRCLSVSLWGPGDGILNQLRGVGQETTQRLRSQNISSFLDVVNTTDDVIDKVAGRSGNFGLELRKAAIAILQNSLKLSAHISEEKLIICELSKNPIISTYEEHINAQESVAVRYTLIAFTDQPNGCLFFQANVEGPGVMSFHCPESFGQISIHLVSSLVGLDDVVIIKSDKENNDPQLKFKSVANKILPQTKNTPDKQQAARTRLSDLNPSSCPRSKRKKVQNNANSGSRNRKATVLGPSTLNTSNSLPCCEARTSYINKVSPFSYDAKISDYANDAGSDNAAHVESPYLKHYEIVESNCRETRSELSTKEEAFEKQSAIIEDTIGYKMEPFDNYVSVENSTSTFSNIKKCSQIRIKTNQTWFRQKREQRAMQSSVFKRKQDNPFQAFQYDPNDAEKNLDLTTNDEDSALGILPKEVFTKMEPKENYGVKRPIRIRSKKGYACSSMNRFDSHAIPAHTLLRMKAEEQQRFKHDYYPMPQNRVHPLLHQESQHSQYPVNGPYILPSSSQHDVLPHLGLRNNFEVPRYMPIPNDNCFQDTFIQSWPSQGISPLPEEVCQLRSSYDQDLNNFPSEQDFWMRQGDTEYRESMQRDYIHERDSLVSRLNTCNSQEIQNGIYGHSGNPFLGDGKHEKKRSYRNYYKAATSPNEVLLDEAFNNAF